MRRFDLRYARLQSGRPFGVTFCQVAPPFCVTCSRPVSLPTQIKPALSGEGATAYITPYPSARAFCASRERSGGPLLLARVAGEIGTDLLPCEAAIDGLEQHLRAEI